MTNTTKKNGDDLPDNTESWENGDLGRSFEHAKVSDTGSEEALDKAAGLKPISIRLDEDMVEGLKHFAAMEELGYQPLIRRILARWLDGEVAAYKRYQESGLEATGVKEYVAKYG